MTQDPTRTDARSQSGRPFLRDAAVGMVLGVAVAVLWLPVLTIIGAPERMMFNFSRRQVEVGEVGSNSCVFPIGELSWRGVGMSCLIFLAMVACTAIGLVGGAWIGGSGGAFVGGVAGYLTPFVAGGISIKRTIGWRACLGIESGRSGSA